ncbi:hypothetical protein ACU686_10015 [Yinghuangia aomiensis]
MEVAQHSSAWENELWGGSMHPRATRWAAGTAAALGRPGGLRAAPALPAPRRPRAAFGPRPPPPAGQGPAPAARATAAAPASAAALAPGPRSAPAASPDRRARRVRGLLGRPPPPGCWRCFHRKFDAAAVPSRRLHESA